MRVLRPASAGAYTGAGTSVGHVDAAGDHTFTANLPIQTGDLIGLDLPDNQGVSGAFRQRASWVFWAIYWPADPAESCSMGQTRQALVHANTGSEVAFNATVEYTDSATTAAKKCKKKKKHKRSAESAKKKCKKKKKH